MLKVIVTGPESSGKTTLAKKLCKHFKVPYIAEYSRVYLSSLERPYTQKDILKIAKGHLANELSKQPFLLLDTDLITLKIWSEYKYGACDNLIISEIKNQKKELRIYLLCQPDIPWKFDTQRENAEDRDYLFNIYKKELNGRDYTIINGTRKNRFIHSVKKINNYLEK